MHGIINCKNSVFTQFYFDRLSLKAGFPRGFFQKMSNNAAPLRPYSYLKQIRTVSLIIVTLILLGGLFAYTVLDQICDVSLSSCFSDPSGVKPFKYLLLAAIRPFILVPSILFSSMGAQAFAGIGFWGVRRDYHFITWQLFSLCLSLWPGKTCRKTLGEPVAFKQPASNFQIYKVSGLENNNIYEGGAFHTI